jgi:carbonic anhydrase
MPKFAAGVIEFQNTVYPEKKALFEQLSKGQAPEALFITCSDSRIETAMITQTDPGELFILRNAGNIVPPHMTHTGGTTASIEFAVAALKVPHIVICGHTECGAMKGALNLEGLDSLPHVKAWLGYSRAAVAVVDELAPEGEANADDRMRALLEQNVILQLQHLRTHPSVAARLAKGDLALHGWVYDIKTGAVDAFDDASGTFIPVDQRYAEEVAKLASQSGCAA